MRSPRTLAALAVATAALLAPSPDATAQSPRRLAESRLLADGPEAARDGTLARYRDELRSAITAELKTPKNAARFCATDAGALAVRQWALLSRAGDAVCADPACRATLEWILADEGALALLLSSGEPSAGRWPDAVRLLAALTSEKERREGLGLRLAVATSLVFAEPVRWMADGSTIDPAARVANFLKWESEGLLDPGFRELSAWELRYVVGSWSSDADLEWARANIKQELRRRDKVGDAAFMLAYNLHNKNGVSVQEGGKFYDNKPMTLAIMLEYGGVCGAISRFGSSMCQAFGVPAMPVGQPGHCAFIWQKEPHRWSINNDISGWAESGCHGGIFIPWGHPAWFVPLMQDAQSDFDAFARAEVLLAVAELAAPGDRSAIAAEACKACPSHFGAWKRRVESASASEARRLAKGGFEEIATALKRQPVAFAQLVNMLPAGEGSESKHARSVAASIASMAKSGADAGLSSWALRSVLEASGRRMAGEGGALLARGDAAPADKLPEAKAREVVDLVLASADALDVAPKGAAHDAWRQAMRRAVRGIVLSPSARESGLRDLERGIGLIARKNRLDDARWIADRIVESAKEAADPELEERAARLRAALG
ncbi:MAG: hypothetical protein ACO31E_08860 [Phycisphaerales bacterium]